MVAMLKYYSQKKFTCNKLEWRVYMENQELIMNDIVDVVMFFVKTGKVDAVFLEENNFDGLGKGKPSIFLTVTYKKALSFEEGRKIEEIFNNFTRKHNINIGFVCYDTYNFGLLDLFSNHQNRYTCKFESNCKPYCLPHRLYDKAGKYKQLQDAYFGKPESERVVVSFLPVSVIKKKILARQEIPLAS